jgi:flavin reductase (DIM6/NTAB) family NADH-FMN oxidoreductase RutF
MADMRSPFDRVVDSLHPPIYVVTATDGEQRSGCLVGFASQSGIDPPRFMVWISRMTIRTR